MTFQALDGKGRNFLDLLDDDFNPIELHYAKDGPTLNDHKYNIRLVCVVHAVWCHFVPEPSTSFSYIPWPVLWLCHQFVTDVTVWLITPNPGCSKNRKIKIK